jgi:hypothetical protein
MGGFEHRRVQVRHGAARGRDDRDRAPGSLRQAESQEAGRTLVDAHMQAQPGLRVRVVQSHRQRR